MFFKNFHHNYRLKTVDYAIPTERGKKESVINHGILFLAGNLVLHSCRSVMKDAFEFLWNT